MSKDESCQGHNQEFEELVRLYLVDFVGRAKGLGNARLLVKVVEPWREMTTRVLEATASLPNHDHRRVSSLSMMLASPQRAVH